MQLVKGQADTLKKQQYLKLREKITAKEKQIEEAKSLVDSQIERRRIELAEKNSPKRKSKSELEREQKLLKQQQIIKERQEQSRITGQRELKMEEHQKKVLEAQIKRENAKTKAQEDLHYILENKKRIAYIK